MLQLVSYKYWHRRFNYIGKTFTGDTNVVKTMVCLIIPLTVILMPKEWIPLEGLTVIHHRAIFIFSLAAIFWIFEPIPVFATSMLVIFLMLVFLSDSGVVYALVGKEESAFGSLIPYQDIMATLASPVIMLFIGGFFLAIAASKYQLDQQMAEWFISPFGSRPRWVMLGIMIITAIFSMFMSNTATAAMMLGILVPVMARLDKEDKGRIGFVLSVPVAANLGGMGTPIGTPPNALALQYLSTTHDIGFGKWMILGVPFVIIMILISWLLLCRMFPASTESIRLKIHEATLASPALSGTLGSSASSATSSATSLVSSASSASSEMARRKSYGYKPLLVYATFCITVFLWLSDFIHGMNSYVVALLPVVVFLCLNILDKEDLKRLNWDVLWLVAGGIALGLALTETGLADVFIRNIPFSGFPVALIFLLCAGLGIVLANFMSNTATANLLIPIIVVIGTSVPGLEKLGGATWLVLVSTFAMSMGMCLPISTPPNALAYGTGLVNTRHLVKTGLIIGLLGFVLAFAMMFLHRYLGII